MGIINLFSKLFKKEKSDTEVYYEERNTNSQIVEVNEETGFQMTVQDVFYITGRGTVVVGTIESGSISVGEEVIIRRNDGTVQKSIIGGIELFRKVADKAFKGDNVGILLNGIERHSIGVGDVIQK